MIIAPITIRPATLDDLAAIVAMLADDPLGATREVVSDPVSPAYRTAFEAISADANNELVVACQAVGTVIGTLQLTFTPSISRRGAWRATIEGVRIARQARSLGLGAQLVEWAVARAEARGCATVQLTTDRSRIDAHRFYERLGFVASHVGMKRLLAHSPPHDGKP
ncbi:MAG: GNAT family N-acetyltransferase [Gemmatimonadota bacterium]